MSDRWCLSATTGVFFRWQKKVEDLQRLQKKLSGLFDSPTGPFAVKTDGVVSSGVLDVVQPSLMTPMCEPVRTACLHAFKKRTEK